MRTSLLFHALVFLLFAFSTQQNLTLAAESVNDTDGNPLVPGELYHILEAKGRARGTQTEQTQEDACPVSVVIGADPKKVIFHAESINLGEPIDLEFAEVSNCATSGNWSVQIHGEKEYPVVIGPPEGAKTMQGVFHISESEEIPYAYYINFKIFGVADYVLTASPYRQNQAFYRVEFCPGEGDEKFNVVFKHYQTP